MPVTEDMVARLQRVEDAFLVQVQRCARARDSIIALRSRLRELRIALAEAEARNQQLTGELAQARDYHLAFSEGLLTAMVDRELRHREERGASRGQEGLSVPSQDSE